MASTASLLFNIAANADEAESTVKSFRALMSKDLGDLGGEFDEWSKEVFGDLSTVTGAMLGIGAAAAAALVAVGAFVAESSAHYQEYVGEIAQASRVTGQSAETMSLLHLAAAETHTSFEALTNGIVKFEGNVVKGAEGNTQLLGTFAKLGVTQNDLKAGEKDLLPLLGKVMDGFQGMASGVDRAAAARALFSKGGPAVMGVLMEGSAGLDDLKKKLDELGITIFDKDVVAFRELQAAEEAFKAQHEAVDTVIGKSTIGMETWAKEVGLATIQTLIHGGALRLLVGDGIGFVQQIVSQYKQINEEIKKQVEISQHAPPPPLTDPDTGPKLEKVKEDYYGITTVLEALRGKIASLGGPGMQLGFEMSKYSEEIQKAKAHIDELQAAGKITADAAARESAALSELPAAIASLWQKNVAKIVADAAAAAQKISADQLKAETDLRGKLAALGESGFEGQRAALARETDAMRASYTARGQMTKELWALINQVYAAGLAKIDAAEKAAADKNNAEAVAKSAQMNERFQSELQRLEQHQESILAQHMTGQQKLALDYQKDLDKFSDVEEQKALREAQTDAEIALIQQRYADVRDSITTKYGQDLQQLQNSQGWQGVFGSKFGEMLKGDEQLLKQWQQSTNQSLMLVKVSLQELKQMAQDSFKQFSQAMGSGAVNAAIQGKSISAAMEQALESTLASIAAQSAVQAIYAAGWGFYDLAIGNEAGAAAAFEAAAIFGTVAAAATVGAKALTPSTPAGGAGGGSGGSGGSGGGSGPANPSGAVAGSAAPASGQPYVQVTVMGHVVGPSGIAELTDMINQAVYGNNVQLYASANASGTKLP